MRYLKLGVKSLSFLTAMSLLAATRLIARASADAPVDPVTTMPEVVVTGKNQKDKKNYKPEKMASSKYTEPLRDVPQTVTVIPQAVIESQGATTLRDVLKNTPGISMQAGEGGTPAGDQMTIRGFSARTDIFIDGVRDFGGYARDPFNVGQVEVVKGPSSSYMGRGSTGGSINMVSKEPGEDVIREGSVGFGTDEYQRYTLDMNQPLDEIGLEGMAVRVNAMLHEADVAERDEVNNGRWGVAPSIAFGLGSPTRVTLSYFRLEQDNQPDYGIPWVPGTNGALPAYQNAPAPVPFSNYYGLVNRDYELVDTNLATFKLEHDFNDSISLRNLFRYGRTYRDSLITAPRFFSDAGTDMRRTDWKTRDQIDSVWDNQTDLTLKFDTGSVGHTLVTGVEFIREKQENYTHGLTDGGLNTDLYNPDPYQPWNGVSFRTGAKTEVTSESAALYVIDTLKLTDQWELVAGGRWDRFDTGVDSVAVNGVITPLQRVDGTFSWRTGVIYKPIEEGSIYAAYGTSFNPAAEGLALSSAATNAANINIEPEKNKSWEFGTKWDILNNRLSLSAALFRTTKANARTEDPSNPNDTIVLQGEQQVEGFELGAAGRITDEWSVYAGYTFLSSEILSSLNQAEIGNQLGNTPEHSLNLWTTYEFPWNLELGGGVQYIDDRFNSNNNLRTAPEYWLWDAVLTYHVNENVDVRLNVNNVTDEEYIGSVGGGHFIPGAGRSASVTTSFKF